MLSGSQELAPPNNVASIGAANIGKSLSRKVGRVITRLNQFHPIP
jgi:hypothetical protein